MFKTNFSGFNTIWGHITKHLGSITPECPLVATELVATITINLFVNLGMVTGNYFIYIPITIPTRYTSFDRGSRS